MSMMNYHVEQLARQAATARVRCASFSTKTNIADGVLIRFIRWRPAHGREAVCWGGGRGGGGEWKDSLGTLFDAMD